MKNWGGMAVLVIAMIALLFWWFWPQQEQTPTKPIATSLQKPTETATAVAKAADKAISDSSSATPDFDPYQDEAIKAQLLQVADLYAETSKYPHFSQPITNLDAVREPKPFEETEVDLPFPIEGQDEPIRLSAAVDRYQYFQGDVINVRLQVVGVDPSTFVQATATIAGSQGDTPLTAQLTPLDPTLTSFAASFDTNIAPPGSLSTEMLVKIEVAVGDETLFTTVAFRYAEAAAQLVAVPYVRTEGAFLLIPLQYTVFTPGYYFANAVLDDAETAQPLLKLQAEGRLPQGNGVLLLRAHISALKAMGSEGPYVLRSINTYRGADVGEAFDVPAANAETRFEIPGFPFSQYDDVPYQDELTKERLEFLRNMGSVDSTESSDQEDQQ